MTIHRLILTSLFIIISALPILAQDIQTLKTGSVRICPVNLKDMSPPEFDGPDCKRQDFWQVDPQGKMLWLRAEITLSDEFKQKIPLGLLISGKIASKVYLNGVLLGQNGEPGETRIKETPGLMDAMLYIPQRLLVAGDNEIAILMSSHHGILNLEYPLHTIGITPYTNPTHVILNRYWPSLLTFGAFVLGAFYFGVAAFRNMDRVGSSLLAFVCVFAGAQLLTETARGFYAYPYPFHDLRLILIVAFSFAFGLCLATHVIEKFYKNRWQQVLLALTLVTSVTILLIPGFDGKAIYAMLLPTLGAFIVTLIKWRRPAATGYAIVLTLFSGITFLTASQFLDIFFFYTLLVLLVFLMVQQARTLSKEQARRQSEEARAQRLQAALDETRETKTPPQLAIKHVGKVEMVNPEQITHCNASGDYVELVFRDGQTILHSGSMNELEAQLPTSFLRVHRSHLVNLNHIKSLKRKASGIGQLQLTTDETIPVSRRIMPKVRTALA